MQAIFNHLEFRIGHNEVVAIDRAASALITALKGSVWITQDGDAVDHVLSAGESYRVGGDAQVVVAALTVASVSIDRARSARGPVARIGRSAMALYLRLARRLDRRPDAGRTRRPTR